MQPGDKVFVKVFRRKWYNQRCERTFEVVRSTGTTVQGKGSPTWYNLSHCVKAPSEEMSHLQNRDVEGSREPKDNVEEHTPDREMHENPQSQNSEGEIVYVVDNVDDSVHISDDARNDFAVNGQERRFSDIVFSTCPDTAGPILVACKAPEISKGYDSTAGQLRDPVRQRSQRV